MRFVMTEKCVMSVTNEQFLTTHPIPLVYTALYTTDDLATTTLTNYDENVELTIVPLSLFS